MRTFSGGAQPHKRKNTISGRLPALTVAALIALSAALFGFAAQGCAEMKSSYDWARDTIEKNYYFYDEVEFDDDGEKSIEKLVDKLDIYSEYFTPEEYDALIQSNAGSKSGIGFSYSFVKEKGGALVVRVLGNSPAKAAGMVAGDVLVKGSVGDEEVEFTSAEAFENFIDARATGEEFTLSTEDKDLVVSKQPYRATYAYMATNSTSWHPVHDVWGRITSLSEEEEGAISCLPDNFAYVNISQFYGTAADEFGVLMRKFNAENCTSLILDLRNNGGGYVSVMQDMAGYFTSTLKDSLPVAMTAEYRNGRQEVYYCYSHSDGLISADKNIYVLANSGTASASEALIGVLVSYGFVDYNDIFISDYGEDFLNWAGEDAKTAQSYGKGIMQSTFRNYYTGEALKLTTARINWPNGKCIHGVGLTASDGCTLVDADWVVTKDDSELQRVINIIQSR